MMCSVINFAPTYNGYPDSIDADKAIMNFNGLTGFSSSVTIDNKTYSTNGGYALATLPAKLMAEEVRDYRSYLQTPVIRVKNIIVAYTIMAMKLNWIVTFSILAIRTTIILG